MALTKQIIGNELYVFNAWGNLIYKRWLNTGASRMFYNGEGLTERCHER